MASRRVRHNPSLSANIYVPSDYESDGQFYPDMPPAPIQRTDEELNISVLRRHNPDVISLEYVAPYAVVYQFSSASQQWEKSGIEGSAFICGLRPTQESPARYDVTVLNRRGLDNFNFELLNASDVEFTEEYIILNTMIESLPKIYGLWIFSEPPPSSTAHHREAMAYKVQECLEKVIMGRGRVEEQTPMGFEEEVEDSIPMGRQLSLKELFGQQRQQDDAWSVRSHSPQRAPIQFVNSADTDFFHNPQRHARAHSPAVSAQSSGQGRDNLIDLFRKAGEGYRVVS
jgi:hypothetical protein